MGEPQEHCNCYKAFKFKNLFETQEIFEKPFCKFISDKKIEQMVKEIVEEVDCELYDEYKEYDDEYFQNRLNKLVDIAKRYIRG